MDRHQIIEETIPFEPAGPDLLLLLEVTSTCESNTSSYTCSTCSSWCTLAPEAPDAPVPPVKPSRSSGTGAPCCELPGDPAGPSDLTKTCRPACPVDPPVLKAQCHLKLPLHLNHLAAPVGQGRLLLLNDVARFPSHLVTGLSNIYL